MIPFLLLTVAPASAANCESQLGAIGGLTPETVAGAYEALVRCSAPVAESNFNRFLEKAGDADSLVALAETAIERDTWKPLWGALSKITSYDARDEVARRVGEACSEKPKTVPFLQGAYFGLRDIEFQQWDDAFSACEDEKLWAWMDKQIATPPASTFDSKYDALMGIYVKHKHADAIPALQAGAIKAAAEGPFDAMLAKMGESVAPELGGDPDPESQARFEAALVEVAKGAPDKARSVASQLANSGSDAAAAQLLPVIFPDRKQSNGGYVYGAAAVEAGDCGGKKTAYIHYATVSESGKRWSILKEIEAPMRALKPKGKGCTVDGAWPVVHTPEPMKSGGDADDFAKTLERDWSAKGYEVKLVKEKGFAL